MDDDIERIINNLEYLRGNIADSVEKELLKTLKTSVQADAKRLSPVDTGHLRNSITADVTRSPDGDIIGTVGTNIAYAAFVEFGTGPVGEASKKVVPPGMNLKYRKDGWPIFIEKLGEFRTTKGQPARPFLYPAYKQNESRIKEGVSNAIQKAIKEGGQS